MATTVVLGIATIVCIFSRHFAFSISRLWAKVVLKIFKIEIKIIDENQGNYSSVSNLYVTLNQTTILETVFGPYAFPTDFAVIVNWEFAIVPIIGWLNALLGGTLIIRQWPEQARNSMNKAANKLSRINLWMSVEGQRSPDGNICAYKKGVALLAISSGATIIPIFYKGARERLPYGEWRVRPGVVEMKFLESFNAKGMTFEDREKLVNQLRAIAERESKK